MAGDAVRSVWDLYLDTDDARTLLEAVVALERHRAVREPVPLEDADLLLERLRRIAHYCAEDAVYWDREAGDRAEAANADGGRWGSAGFAATMTEVATGLAELSRHIAAVAGTAADDLAPRLAAAPTTTAAAEEATREEARRLLERHDEAGD